jgi:purine nucleoside permease
VNNSPPSLDILVLPAFAAEDFRLPDDHDESADDLPSELDYWLDAYDFTNEIQVRGANAPVWYTDDGVGITPTGMGKTAAATTVTALLASPEIDLSEAHFVTAGVAGAPPDVATVGSVFVADAVVDWDLKHRWADGDGEDEGTTVGRIDLLKYRPHDYVHRLDEDLVATAVEVAEAVELTDSEAATDYRERYDEAAAHESPSVGVGATVCGDEFWHGRPLSEQAAWLVEQYDAGVYATSEMEDFGTATALANFGKLDHYLSVRGVVNFDRPAPGQSASESLADGGLFLDLGLENAFRVASAVVDRLK